MINHNILKNLTTEQRIALLKELSNPPKSTGERIFDGILNFSIIGFAVWAGYKIGTLPSNAGRSLRSCR
jgi:hypothetical protein